MKDDKRKYRFEIREIDAWTEPSPDDPNDTRPAWTWNSSFYLGEMKTAAENLPRALAAWLKKTRGIVFYPARVRYSDDGSIVEIQDRKTGEPLIAAIPMDY